MLTAAKDIDTLERCGAVVVDDHDIVYYESSWARLNKIFRSGTASIIFTGNVMTDSTDVYRTFTIHPEDSNLSSYSVAVPAEE